MSHSQNGRYSEGVNDARQVHNLTDYELGVHHLHPRSTFLCYKYSVPCHVGMINDISDAVMGNGIPPPIAIFIN